MSYYMHHVPGRLRVKSPLIKGNERRAEEVRSLIESMGGVTSTAVNTLTGSVVVNYDSSAIEAGQIQDTLNRTGYFDTSRAVTNDEYIHGMASKAGQVIGKAVFGAFVEKAFEGSAFSLLAVLI
ncbi:MAG TPA: cation transporter [Dissulfurispiraceae bacterium]|nr:cation transporter [Dissulfurispiraceae bacterium]